MRSQRFHNPGSWHRTAIVAAVLAMAAGTAAAAETGAAVPKPSASTSATVNDRIRELEKQIQQLRTDTRVLEVADEARTKAKPVAGYQDGFFLNSPDGKAFKLKLGGYVQADSRFALDEKDNPTVDSFSLRRARLDFRGTVGELFDFRILPDFAGSTLVLQARLGHPVDAAYPLHGVSVSADVTDTAAAACPNAMAALGAAPSARTAANAPTNVSPAAVVSMACATGAGISWRASPST